MLTPVIQSQLSQTLALHGMALRGGFAVTGNDGVPHLADGRPAHTLLLVGNIGGAMWPAFAASCGFADTHPDRMDRWTKTVIDALATEIGAVALYPFSGPPYFPFQRWAARAEPVHVSPLRIFIHPTYGLWHAYRAALIFAEPFDLAPAAFAESPCASCADRPCLSTCPVGAFQESGFDDLGCARHVDGPHGAECRDNGCLARRACPVGRAYSYPPPQMAFHMEAFLARRR
nr:ferredoxin [uncultured Dongia sp.]